MTKIMIIDVNDDILRIMMSYLPKKNIFICRSICKYWKYVLKCEITEKILSKNIPVYIEYNRDIELCNVSKMFKNEDKIIIYVNNYSNYYSNYYSKYIAMIDIKNFEKKK